MEHLQKIPYLLSVFFPIAAFFTLGLWLAWWFWYKDSKKLTKELSKTKTISSKIATLGEKELKLVDKFTGAIALQETNWKNQLKSKTDSLANAQKEITKLQSTQKDLKDKFAVGAKEYTELEDRYKNIKTDKNKEISQIMSTHELTKSDLSTKDEKIAELEALLKDKNNSFTALNKDLETKSSACDQLQTEAKEYKQVLNTKNTNISELQDKLNQSQSELAKAKDEHSKCNNTINDLKTQLTDTSKLETINSDLNNAQASLDQEKTEHGKTKQEKTSLENQLKDTTNKLSFAQTQLSNTESALEKEKNKASEPPSPATYFAKASVNQDQRYGFLYSQKPDQVDKLTRIKGVGEVLEPKLNEFGIYQFKQIALWSQDNIDAFSEDLDFPGRVEREQWVNQAADLHREDYKEHLAPIINIYHPAQTRTIIKEVEVEPAQTEFSGESVKEDKELGIVFTSKPKEIDDLKKISGVAGVLEQKLHDFGVYRFKQIMLWNKDQIETFSDKLSFPGRIERDEWLKQAAEFHKEKYES